MGGVKIPPYTMHNTSPLNAGSGFLAFVTLIGSLLHYLPDVAAVVAIALYATQLYFTLKNKGK